MVMFTDLRCSPSCTHAGVHGTVSICPPDCFEYKGTLDVFYKIIRQGFGRLWRGTNAGLALVIPTVRIYLPCYDIFRNWFEEFAAENAPSMTPYAPLLVGTIDGGAADCQFWHRNLGIKCRLHELANKSRISVTGASKMLANILYFLPWDGQRRRTSQGTNKPSTESTQLLSSVPTRGRHSCGLVACSRSPFKIVDGPASSAVGNPVTVALDKQEFKCFSSYVN
ncbi:hypothetical protein Lser_V15G09900 [Lactuca serriola]